MILKSPWEHKKKIGIQNSSYDHSSAVTVVVGSNVVSVVDGGAGGSVIVAGECWESSPGSSSSNCASFSLDGFPLRSFDRLFWNQTLRKINHLDND